MSQPLILPDGVVYTCQNSGACCRNDWLIGVDTASHERLRDVDWRRVDPAIPPGDKFVPLPLPLAGGERITFARKPCGECVFLTADVRCSIHRHLGAPAKPQVCREFPYVFVDTPDGVAVGLSFACTAVRGHQGQALHQQQPEIRGVLAGSSRVNRLPDPLVLYSGLDIGWEDYRPIEAALLDLLGRDDQPLARSLIAGSVLVNVCVGLRQVETRAREAGRTPAETLRSGLERLRAEDYRRLFAVAASVRYPKRASLAHLAPLYAWLELSRAKISRFALVWALYRDYFAFRKRRWRVPDLVTGGERVDLRAVDRVRFPADAETERFLRRYWTHVVFRKTLTPMHGVFRGYHTMLALHGFTRWAAKVIALRAQRDEATVDDVRDAVRLVEQRFVLHSQFGNVFSVSPVLTILADRLFGAPGFVPAAVLM